MRKRAVTPASGSSMSQRASARLTSSGGRTSTSVHSLPIEPTQVQAIAVESGSSASRATRSPLLSESTSRNSCALRPTTIDAGRLSEPAFGAVSAEASVRRCADRRNTSNPFCRESPCCTWASNRASLWPVSPVHSATSSPGVSRNSLELSRYTRPATSPPAAAITRQGPPGRTLQAALGTGNLSRRGAKGCHEPPLSSQPP
jgi:hypothetical protein